MKVEIDQVLNPLAAGPWQGSAAIVAGDPKRNVGPQAALLLQGEGKTIRIVCSPEEAALLGSMLHVVGCVAQGGMPPVIAAQPDPSPLIINGSH